MRDTDRLNLPILQCIYLFMRMLYIYENVYLQIGYPTPIPYLVIYTYIYCRYMCIYIEFIRWLYSRYSYGMRCISTLCMYAHTRVDSRSAVRILLAQAYVARRASLHMSPYVQYLRCDAILLLYYKRWKHLNFVWNYRTWSLDNLRVWLYYKAKFSSRQRDLWYNLYIYLSISNMGHCIIFIWNVSSHKNLYNTLLCTLYNVQVHTCIL